jgi:hypothetical protein
MEPILTAGAVLLSSWIVSSTINQGFLGGNRNKSSKSTPSPSLFTKFWEYLSSSPSEFDRKGEALLIDRVEALNGKIRDAIHGKALRCYKAFMLIHLTETQILHNLEQETASYNCKNIDQVIEHVFRNFKNDVPLDYEQLTNKALANPSSTYITSLPEWKSPLSFEDIHQLVKKAFEDLRECQDEIIASSSSELAPFMPLESPFRKFSITINADSTPEKCLSQFIQQVPQQTRNIQQLLSMTDRLSKICMNDELCQDFTSQLIQNMVTSVLQKHLKKSIANNGRQIMDKIQTTLIDQIRLSYQFFIEHHLAQISSPRIKIKMELNNIDFRLVDKLATQAYQEYLASIDHICLGCLTQLGYSKEDLEKEHGRVIVLDVDTILSSKMCLTELIQAAPDQTKNIQRLVNFFKVLSSPQLVHQKPDTQHVNITYCEEIQFFVNSKISSAMRI